VLGRAEHNFEIQWNPIVRVQKIATDGHNRNLCQFLFVILLASSAEKKLKKFSSNRIYLEQAALVMKTPGMCTTSRI
jgi:hypothetical protein